MLNYKFQNFIWKLFCVINTWKSILIFLNIFQSQHFRSFFLEGNRPILVFFMNHWNLSVKRQTSFKVILHLMCGISDLQQCMSNYKNYVVIFYLKTFCPFSPLSMLLTFKSRFAFSYNITHTGYCCKLDLPLYKIMSSLLIPFLRK